MKYEWEADALDVLFALIEQINKNPKYHDTPFAIIGFAVENEENGEGAYLSVVENDGSILLSDIMSDVRSDVDKFYQLTIKNRKWR